jgi:hypothetical protein
MKAENIKCVKGITKGVSDSDYAGGKDMHRSISGYDIYINGVLISWKSSEEWDIEFY